MNTADRYGHLGGACDEFRAAVNAGTYIHDEAGYWIELVGPNKFRAKRPLTRCPFCHVELYWPMTRYK